MFEYWRRNVGHIQVYRYHLEKVGHSLLLATLGVFLGVPHLASAILATVGYLLIGKALVRSTPSRDWIADLVIGSLAVVAMLALIGNPWANAALLVWFGLYGWLVLDWRWASP